jgi:hypothetical protein
MSTLQEIEAAVLRLPALTTTSVIRDEPALTPGRTCSFTNRQPSRHLLR